MTADGNKTNSSDVRIHSRFCLPNLLNNAMILNSQVCLEGNQSKQHNHSAQKTQKYCPCQDLCALNTATTNKTGFITELREGRTIVVQIANKSEYLILNREDKCTILAGTQESKLDKTIIRSWALILTCDCDLEEASFIFLLAFLR